MKPNEPTETAPPDTIYLQWQDDGDEVSWCPDRVNDEDVEYRRPRLTCPVEEVIAGIVKDIIYDISDRRGLKQEWRQIDEDVQDEIRSTWADIIRSRMQPKEAIDDND